MFEKIFKIKRKKIKTNAQEVLDYIVRMERSNFKMTGKEGIYPSTNQICLVFGITRSRASQYYQELKKRLKKDFRETKAYKLNK